LKRAGWQDWDSRTRVTELICTSCLKLDDKDFAAYLALCDEAYHYEITTFSPEIRKPMTWLAHDKPGLATLFANLPKHNSDASPLSRHVTVYTVTLSDDGGSADVVSALQVFRTALDGGATELFAVGKLFDRVALGHGNGPARLLRRNVRLDTRVLGYGHHIPF
jgi:methanesulfonate monooxygenase small subunit